MDWDEAINIKTKPGNAARGAGSPMIAGVRV